jgi:hypothetical protein
VGLPVHAELTKMRLDRRVGNWWFRYASMPVCQYASTPVYCCKECQYEASRQRQYLILHCRKLIHLALCAQAIILYQPPHCTSRLAFQLKPTSAPAFHSSSWYLPPKAHLNFTGANGMISRPRFCLSGPYQRRPIRYHMQPR